MHPKHIGNLGERNAPRGYQLNPNTGEKIYFESRGYKVSNGVGSVGTGGGGGWWSRFGKGVLGRVGKFALRAVPILGWALLAKDVYDIATELGGVDLQLPFDFEHSSKLFANEVSSFQSLINNIEVDFLNGSIKIDEGENGCNGDGFTMEDFLLALKFVYLYEGREPSFSLDPNNPQDVSGPLLKKVYYPEIMRGSSFGDTLFITDYLLKQYSMGVLIQSNNGTITPFRSCIGGLKNEAQILIESEQNGSSGNPNQWARLWITVDHIDVKSRSIGDSLSNSGIKNMITFGDIKMKIKSKLQRVDKNSSTGLSDVSSVDCDDDNHSSSSKFAALFTQFYDEVGKKEQPHFSRLKELVKVVYIAKLFYNAKIEIDFQMVDQIIDHLQKMKKPLSNISPNFSSNLDTANTIYFTHKINEGRSFSFTGGVCLTLPNFQANGDNFKIKVDRPTLSLNTSGKIIANKPRTKEFSFFPIFSEDQKHIAFARDCFYTKKEPLSALLWIEKAFDQFYSSLCESPSDSLLDPQFLSPFYYDLLDEIAIYYSKEDKSLDLSRERKIFQLNYYLSIASKPINSEDAPQLRLALDNCANSLSSFYSSLPLDEEALEWGPFSFSVPKGWVQQFGTDDLENCIPGDFSFPSTSLNLFVHPQMNELSFASGTSDIFHFSISSLPNDFENFGQYYQKTIADFIPSLSCAKIWETKFTDENLQSFLISFSIPHVKGGQIRITLWTLFYMDCLFSITTISSQSHHVCLRSLLSRIISSVKVSTEEFYTSGTMMEGEREYNYDNGNEYIGNNQWEWQEECFYCVVCNCEINGTFGMVNDLPHCLNCTNIQEKLNVKEQQNNQMLDRSQLEIVLEESLKKLGNAHNDVSEDDFAKAIALSLIVEKQSSNILPSFDDEIELAKIQSQSQLNNPQPVQNDLSEEEQLNLALSLSKGELLDNNFVTTQKSPNRMDVVNLMEMLQCSEYEAIYALNTYSSVELLNFRSYQ